MPDTDNFFKYLLTVGVLMILFGLIYPLKQEQGLRTKLIEIKEKDSLLRIEVKFLELQVADLDSLQRKTERKVAELKKRKNKASSSEKESLDERIMSLVDNFDGKRAIGLNAAKNAKLKSANLLYEHERYDETNRQIKEYFLFKTIFWGLGIVLTIAGLFFWMDSTYYDELVKIQEQDTYRSKYALCITRVYSVTRRFKWLLRILLILIIFSGVYFFITKA